MLSGYSDSVKNAFEDDFDVVAEYSDRDDPVKYSYLHMFFEKKGLEQDDKKPFVRNTERLLNGNLGADEIPKVLSSMLTHLHIEDSNGNTVPEQVIEGIREKHEWSLDDPEQVAEEYINDIRSLELVDDGGN